MTSKKNIYWIPLLEYSKDKQKIIWSGRSLPIPIKYPIYKESLVTGFGITTELIGVKKGLFVKLGKDKKYLLGINNIFKSPTINSSNENWKYNNEEEIQTILKTTINNKFTEDKLQSPKSGIQLKMSGRLGGANKSSRVVVNTGSFRPQSFDSKLDYANTDIFTKWGVLGLKVYLS